MRDPHTMSVSKAARAAALAASLLTALLTPSCATMFAPGPDMVPVNSVPEGARVQLDGVAVGRTPCTVAFTRPGEGVLRLEAPGYEVATVDKDKVFNGMFLLNLLWGLASPACMLVDFATSNQGRYSVSPVFVELISATSTPASPGHPAAPAAPSR